MKREQMKSTFVPPFIYWTENLKLPDFNIIDFQAFVNGKESIAYSMRDDL